MTWLSSSPSKPNQWASADMSWEDTWREVFNLWTGYMLAVAVQGEAELVDRHAEDTDDKNAQELIQDLLNPMQINIKRETTDLDNS